MAVVPPSKCHWNVCKDCNQFFLEDRQILVHWLSVDFGYRFLLNFVSNVRSHSHSCKVMLSALVIELRITAKQ